MSPDNLEAVMMPDGTIQLEWAPATGSIDEHSELLQNKIHKQYSSDPDGWFFYLGFCNTKVALSPSLNFWHRFSRLFTRKLRLASDIEAQRGKIRFPLPEEELALQLDQTPLMPGGEYLQEEKFRVLWEGLHKTFSQKIDAFSGSVAEFVKEYSPDIHLVGPKRTVAHRRRKAPSRESSGR